MGEAGLAGLAIQEGVGEVMTGQNDTEEPKLNPSDDAKYIGSEIRSGFRWIALIVALSFLGHQCAISRTLDEIEDTIDDRGYDIKNEINKR